MSLYMLQLLVLLVHLLLLSLYSLALHLLIGRILADEGRRRYICVRFLALKMNISLS